MKTVQPTTSKVYSICYSKGISHHHSCLAETQSWAEKIGFQWGKKGGFQICHYWRHREVAEELTRNGASYVIGQRLHIWLFPIGPKVEVGAKIRKSVSYCSLCADCYKSYGLASCTHCCYILTLWVRVLFLYMIWPLLFAYSVSQMHIDGDEEFN